MNVIQSLLLTKIQLFMWENTVKQQILFYHFTKHPGPGYNLICFQSDIVENKNKI